MSVAEKRSPSVHEPFGWGKDELARFAEREARVEQTTRCLFCNRTHVGTETSGKAWHAKHRAKHHPEAVDRGLWARQQAARNPVYR